MEKAGSAGFAASEKERTGISSLKVGFNKVFGYYLEISKANLHLAPPDYIRKQTLVNGERYITEDLKRKEGEVLGAEEKRVALEQDIFEAVRTKISFENKRIRETTDCYRSNRRLGRSCRNGGTKPLYVPRNQ